MKKFFLHLTVTLASLLVLIMPLITFAQGQSTQSDECPEGSWCLPNPLKFDNVWELLQGMAGLSVRFGTVLAVLAFIYSGFLYVTAIGNPTKLQKAHTTLKYVVIGTIIIMSATLVVNVVVQTLSRINAGGN